MGDTPTAHPKLYPAYVRIAYRPTRCTAISFEGQWDETIRLTYAFGRDPWSRWNPTEDDPQFWRKVKQLSFAFKTDHRAAIRDFYTEYGPLGFFRDENEDAEDAWQAVDWLQWFRTLTAMVENVKKRKTGFLWDLFGEPGKQYDQPYVDLLGRLGAMPCLRFEAWHSPRYAGKVYTWAPQRRPRGVDDPPRVAPAAGPTGEFPDTVYLGPTSDEELFTAALQVAIDASRAAIAQFLIWPEAKNSGEDEVPFSVLSFFVRGAFGAAFLQWFFAEMAPMNIRPCAADGCNNWVERERRAYCCDACRWRQKKRRQREGQRARERSGSNGEA